VLACASGMVGLVCTATAQTVDLVPAHPRPADALAVHPLRVDGVRQAIRPFQRVDDVRAAPLLVAVADRLTVEVDARRHDMHMVLGVRHDDVISSREIEP